MRLTKRHILFIPSWYPSSDAPLLGTFFREQAEMFAEVGHNVGLMHNFEASSDALNYGPEFWRIQELPADMEEGVPNGFCFQSTQIGPAQQSVVGIHAVEIRPALGALTVAAGQ